VLCSWANGGSKRLKANI